MTPDTRHTHLKLTEHILENGLRVIIHEDHAIPIVAVDVCYHVGSKNEHPERTGFAHLFEHLMFDGSRNVKRGEFDRYITRAGGWNNAYTAWDKTNYYEVLPSNQIELALWLESDRMMDLDITDVSLETQRSVVKEERRWRVDNQPYGTSEEQIFNRAYRHHPYRWPVIGSMDHLDRASLSDVREFFAAYYVPNNAVLVLVGDVNPDEGVELARKYFGEIPRSGNDIQRPAIVEPPQQMEERFEIMDNIQLPALFMAFRIPEEGHPDFFPLALASDILTNGDSSRLYRRLVYEQKIAQDVSSIVYNLEEPGLLWISATSMDSTPAGLLEEEVLKSIADIQSEGVTDEELQKVKNQTESSATLGKQRVDQKADMIAHYAVLRNDPGLVNTDIQNYYNVTTDDIRRVVRTYCVREGRTVAHYIPKS